MTKGKCLFCKEKMTVIKLDREIIKDVKQPQEYKIIHKCNKSNGFWKFMEGFYPKETFTIYK